MRQRHPYAAAVVAAAHVLSLLGKHRGEELLLALDNPNGTPPFRYVPGRWERVVIWLVVAGPVRPDGVYVIIGLLRRL
jgi:hypothetical protein